MKTGLEYAILWRRAPRDNLQFCHAAIPFVPEAVRYTILNVMRQQFKDGHLIRRWTPILETKYADAPSWLVTTTCDYLKYTNDFEILDENKDRKIGLPTSSVTVLWRKRINRTINIHILIMPRELLLDLPFIPLRDCHDQSHFLLDLSHVSSCTLFCEGEQKA